MAVEQVAAVRSTNQYKSTTVTCIQELNNIDRTLKAQQIVRQLKHWWTAEHNDETLTELRPRGSPLLRKHGSAIVRKGIPIEPILSTVPQQHQKLPRLVDKFTKQIWPKLTAYSLRDMSGFVEEVNDFNTKSKFIVPMKYVL